MSQIPHYEANLVIHALQEVQEHEDLCLSGISSAHTRIVHFRGCGELGAG